MSPEKKKKLKQKSFFRRWHRRMGIVISLFLFNIAITGILLNHYEALALHEKHIESEWLLSWYNVQASEKINCINKGDFKICQVDTQIYLIDQNKNVKLLFNNQARLINLLTQLNETFLITREYIYIFDHYFNLLDSVNIKEKLLLEIENAWIEQQQLVIQTHKNSFIFNSTTFDLTPKSLEQNNENSLANIFYPLKDVFLIKTLNQKYKRQQITLLKLVQDLHSGQLFFPAGKLVSDITAIILILLAISGFITWQRRKTREKV